MCVSKEVIEKWKNEPIDPRLKLPELNQFIPTDFSLCCDDNDDNDEVVVDSKNDKEDGNGSSSNENKKETTETSKSLPPFTPPELIQQPSGLRLWHK
eukprot:10413043-Ditylum_brightwellii.AAC.1